MHTARLNERTPFHGQVDILPPTGAPRLSAWGQDVSETGMFLQTTQPFAVGDLVSLRFTLDKEDVYIAAAEVAWVRRFEPVNVDGSVPGIGLRFVAIDSFTRSVVRRAVKAGAADVVRADVHTGPKSLPKPKDASGLPAPTMTLPPLSPSIIEAAGGRDLEDTQDLLPPPSVRRAPDEKTPSTTTAATTTSSSEGQENFSMLPFRPLDQVSLPPDEPNLSPEARVFGGVPATPRPVTMAPRRSSGPPALARSATSATSATSVPALPTTALPHPSSSSTLPDATAATSRRSVKETQKLFTLPPISVVESFAESQLPDVRGPDGAGAEDLVVVAEAADPWAGWGFVVVGAAVAARDTIVADADDDADDDSARFTDDELDVDAIALQALSELPRIHNPSILEAQTLPPLLTLVPVTAVPTAAAEHSHLPATPSMIISAELTDGADDDADDGDGFSMGPISAQRTTPPQAFSANDESPMHVRHLALGLSDDAPQSSVARRRQQRERQPRRTQFVASTASVEPRRRGPLVAAGILAMGCAAGAAVVMLPSPFGSGSTAVVTPPAATTTVAAATTTPTPVFTTPTTTTTTPAPEAVAAPKSVAVAEAELRYAPPQPQAVAKAEAIAKVEAKAPKSTAPTPTQTEPKTEAAQEPAQEAAPEAAPEAAQETALTTALAVVAEPAPRAVSLPGRFSVDLPVGGRIARVFALAGPARVVIDLEDATLPTAARDVDEGGVLQVRFGQPSPGRQRVVVVLSGQDRPDAVDARLDGDQLVTSWQF
jgi:Tfp pilus assembly protein PilZ